MVNSKKSLHELLKKYCDFQQIPADNNIFDFGEKAEKLYLILEGKVTIHIKKENNKEKHIATLKSGDILGEAALLKKQDHSSKATAAINTNLLSCSPETFKKIMTEQPDFTDKLIKNLCNRIQILQKPETKETVIDQADSEKITENISESEVKENENNKNNEENNSKEKDNEDIKTNTDLYLKGHGNYPEKAKKSFDYYLYTKETKCPVCKSNLEVKKIRNSRLNLQEVRYDLKAVYKNFKPYWYKVWICPNCFYTAPKRNFFDLSKKNKEKIKEQFKQKVQNVFGTNYKPNFSEPRKLNEVFNAYYLSNELFELIDANKNNFTYSWLRLSWLYEDIEENELSKKASHKAMEYLQDFYFNDDSANLSNSQKNKLTLLLSALYYKHGLEKDAIPLLNELIQSHRTKRVHRNKARDLFYKIRKSQKKKQG